MMRWEYCSVRLGSSGLAFKPKYVVFIVYYKPNDRHAERIDTDVDVKEENALVAIGQTLAYLAQQGWEVVWLQHSQAEYVFGLWLEALLKRQVTSATP